MRKKQLLCMFLTVLLLLCGCAQSGIIDREEAGIMENSLLNGRLEGETGRYREEHIELPDLSVVYAGIVQEGNTIRLANAYGTDLISTDGGKTFEKAELIRSAMRDRRYATFAFAEAPDGSRLLKEWKKDSMVWELITAKDESFVLEALSGEQNTYAYVECCYGGGFFYSTDGDGKIYQTDPQSRRSRLLTQASDPVLQLAAGEKLVYIVTQKGILIYDLEKEQQAEQNQQLSDFLAQTVKNGETSAFLYCYQENLYILTHEGLYCYLSNAESLEQLLDGNYALSDMDREFNGLAVIEEEGSTAFLILYSDGELMRYICGPDGEAAQETLLWIYSVYEDSNLSRAVSGFRRLHPELRIQYDIGMTSSYGMTLEDALRNLSTEIAAGNGPDILLMDCIPYSAYKEKGVLLDLSSFYKELPQNAYFTTVLEGFTEEDGLYMLPAAFILPVMCWKQESYGSAETLSGMADMMEAARKNQAEGFLLNVITAPNVLRLFSQSSMGAWVDRKGNIDRDAIYEFFYQTKRIYAAETSGITEELKKYNMDGEEEYFTENMWEKRFLSTDICDWSFPVSYPGYPDFSFFGGYLKGSNESMLFGSYVSLFGFLDHYQIDLSFMPGQKYGACLPVTLLSVNRSTAHLEESMMFLDYIFSEDFQKTEGLFGIPVNRSAYDQWKADPRGADQENEVIYRLTWSDGEHYAEFGWPDRESFEILDSLINNITGVHFCDKQIYDTIIKAGQSALEDECSIEEAVEAAEKTLQIYLAE